MVEVKKEMTPLGKLFAILTKQYLSILSSKLRGLPIDRYFYAFWVISNNDGEITSKRLAEVLQTDKVLVVRIIKHLTEMNFIERLKHPNDKRSFLLHVTPFGIKHVPAIEKALIETDQEFTDAIGTENKDLVLSGITNLVNKIGPIEGDRIVLEYKRLNK
jgi:DNA-binding MarR family transcriptional regulator